MARNITKKRMVKRISLLMQRKLAGLFALVLLALVGLLLRVTYINANNGSEYSKQVLSQAQQQYASRVMPARRGDILDRNGNVLATSTKVYNLILDCEVILTEVKVSDKKTETPYIEPTVSAIVDFFDLDSNEVYGVLHQPDNAKSNYYVIKQNVTVEEKNAWEESIEVGPYDEDDKAAAAEAERKMNIKGIWFEETYARSYPFSTLACDVIGFTSSLNSADTGIEGYYNSVLTGVDGRKYGYYTEYSDVEQNIISPKSGKSIVSTLDVGAQQIVEKYVNGWNEAMGSKNIGVIVMDPNNGEILAMDGGDRYDLNDPRDLSLNYSDKEIRNMNDYETVDALSNLWSNFCVSAAFEPGSVVKPIVVASALEKGSIVTTDHFLCDGGERFGKGDDAYIQCWVAPSMHGEQSLAQIISNSCNDGMMQIGALMGVEQFLKTQTLFNFGSRTGIDLPNESSGMIHTVDSMKGMELATGTMGQGFTCTMLQEMTAFCSVINGGYYYQPHVVASIKDANGSVVRTTGTTLLKQTVSDQISDACREFMEETLVNGTGQNARIYGYRVGGKTGTAEKYPRGNGKYVVSFIGFAPIEAPKVAVYVVIDEPNAEYQDNSAYAQFVAQGILYELMPYLNIQPTDTDSIGKSTALWSGFAGHLRDIDIKLSINKDGFYLDENGYRVDSEGRRIDQEGYRMDEGGNYLLDDDGKKIRTDAEIVFTSEAYKTESVDGTFFPEPVKPDENEIRLDNDLQTEGITNEEAGLE